MQIWMTLVLALQLLSALVMIGLVLIQHGKGADMGASFGSGSSGSLFGATGSANFLSRSTAACATVFFICTLALALLSNFGMNRAGHQGGTSVLDRPAMAGQRAGVAGGHSGGHPGCHSGRQGRRHRRAGEGACRCVRPGHRSRASEGPWPCPMPGSEGSRRQGSPLFSG
jgi:preprotein translocase subunit SecG